MAGALDIHYASDAEIKRMKVLMEKCCDTPMDLADASLVAAAEALEQRRVFTLDSDFRVYQIDGTISFEIVP